MKYPDLFEPERIDIPQAPHQLVRLADDPARDRYAAREHVLFEHLVAEGVEGVDFQVQVRSYGFYSLAHLGGGFFGEGEG